MSHNAIISVLRLRSIDGTKSAAHEFGFHHFQWIFTHPHISYWSIVVLTVYIYLSIISMCHAVTCDPAHYVHCVYVCAKYWALRYSWMYLVCTWYGFLNANILISISDVGLKPMMCYIIDNQYILQIVMVQLYTLYGHHMCNICIDSDCM